MLHGPWSMVYGPLDHGSFESFAHGPMGPLVANWSIRPLVLGEPMVTCSAVE